MRRPCIDCRRLCEGSRCADCERPRERERTRRKRVARPYTTRERNRRAAAVTEHRRRFGDWCPGWQREPHEANVLTADHVHAVADGGPEDGPLQVLCVRCNSRKGSSSEPTVITQRDEQSVMLPGVA